MLAGHFGAAAAVKAFEPKLPLWALLVSTQLLDIAFIPFLLAGLESIEKIEGGGYGEQIIHADYTHSLVGALLLCLITALISWRIWNLRSGIVIGALAFSHWLLDLIVHRADMPLLPGNYGDFPLLGLGLWQLPYMSGIFELALILLGGMLYFRSVLKRSTTASPKRAYWSGTIMALFLALVFVSDFIGL